MSSGDPTPAATMPPPGEAGGLLDGDDLLDLRPRARGTDAAAVVAEEASRRTQAPAANAALEQHKAAVAAGATGSCHLCAVPARTSCTSCRKPTCAAHRWTMFGLCTSCATEERMGRWHRKPEAEQTNWLQGGPGPAPTSPPSDGAGPRDGSRAREQP